MIITCPHCGFSTEVSPENIPADSTEATCPKCKNSFPLQQEGVEGPPAASGTQPDEGEVTCPACGRRQPSGSYCIACGIDYAKWHRRQEQDRADAEQVTCPFCGHVQSLATACLRCGGILSTATSRESIAYAGFWVRCVAAIVDSIAVWILQLLLTLAMGAMVGLIAPNSGSESFASIILLGLFSSAVGMAYYVVFTGACGQTPGKMLLRLKVVRSDGTGMTYGRAALREILGKFVSGITLGVGYLMVAFDDRKQGLHDKIADTCVIRL
ncbi:MAG: hypothetical protein PWP34_538 [Desulfuromonadales bacterium]|jgi:predicted Zn finger-like uncharacterized protein|nr:hypothetical protein [Desulfuromonadales bacterium]